MPPPFSLLRSRKGFDFKLVALVLAAIFILSYAIYAAEYGGSIIPNPEGKAVKTVRVTGILDFNPQVGQPLTITQLNALVVRNSVITGTCKTGELAVTFFPSASNIKVTPQVFDPGTGTWYSFKPCESKSLNQFSQTNPVTWEFKVPPGTYRTRAVVEGDLSGLLFNLGRKSYVSDEVVVHVPE